MQRTSLPVLQPLPASISFLGSLCNRFSKACSAQQNRLLEISCPVCVNGIAALLRNPIAYSKYGAQLILEETRKVFGQALSVLPL